MARKLMFYWTILRKSDNELVKAVFNAQREFPSQNDWISEVQGVLKNCRIFNTDEEILKMNKNKFKKIVKEKIQLRVTSYLIGLQNKHSKSHKLKAGKEMQSYLKTEIISISEKKTLFKLRSKMLRIKSNFKTSHKNDLKCSLCFDETSTENEEHLLRCPTLLNQLGNEIGNVKFQNVYLDIKKQEEAVKLFMKIMNIYEQNK